MNCHLEAACLPDHIVWLRVRGRATYASAPALRAFAAERRQQAARRLQVDLAECVSMDSTFIGVLTGIAMRKDTDGMEVGLVNAPEHVARQIHGLGLGRFFLFAQAPAPDAEWACLDSNHVDAEERSDRLRTTMLAAHATLGQANAENVARFEHVIDALRKDGA